MTDRKRVVIVGAGFGGISAAKKLAGKEVDVVLIDRRNHHLFQPLLYQVATADLSPAEIAWPIRSIFSSYANVSVFMGEVTGLDLAGRRVIAGDRDLGFDYLVIATGAVTSYFGNDHWAKVAPGLKNITEATDIRKRLLLAFEQAENSEDPEERRRLLNFIVVGGGPTGVEMAGAIAELAKQALSHDFRRIDPRDARIILAEGGPRLLAAFPEDLSDYTQKSLENIGVEVRTNHQVSDITALGAQIGDEFIPSANVIWGAGVRVDHLGDWTGHETDRGGRMMVNADLSIPGHDDVFVIGDAAHVPWRDGLTVPGIAPAAKQQGKYVGARILDHMAGRKTKPFAYRHAGNLATIGRHRAVIDFNGFKLRGWLAWWFWGLAHIYFLIGLRAPALVMVQWVWSYLFRKKGARLITGQMPGETADPVTPPVN
ncbi:NAD(P)/FAD-dependent oxidoreductase [Thalassospira alkalitolerans]|uniref:NADH:ubiquinone reductase (non-electrogenic) n=1 Tax=Thalassospira alkalitolerans TaxID=1293890 RepID=A0A1Y2LBD8_9PROT|nr:NAD(P)/FAD-dependent oxidoreductase [Thalassospira alkalitolerans]OSQ47979.1 pyridine nucleotide-disulfide oxidoreductase [Thalassospira alkalitolerans]|tara:strand:- start:36419 stop:37702 length:1284 start_codon:yes stop_codon:yes gene_type:complete